MVQNNNKMVQNNNKIVQNNKYNKQSDLQKSSLNNIGM